ncbi:hypothetical protein ACGGZK_08645 [Agromyces sp. MMS24-K17]|uniref:DUF4190 domain-containing protein n=1 Tax=Agromyces sp. MMS24-K17 TaxID=3372850 RepID=UPI003753EAF5
MAPAPAEAPVDVPAAGSPGRSVPSAGVPSAGVPSTDGPAPNLPPVAHPAEAADGDDPLAPYRPAEPTFRADPAVIEYEERLDTAQLRTVPTGQLLIVHRPGVAPSAVADVEEEDAQRRVYSWVAAVIGVLGAAGSLFVGWMLPLAIAAIVFGVLGLRREEHGRTLAFVGIGAGLTGLVFSAVWIGYYAIVFGALPH